MTVVWQVAAGPPDRSYADQFLKCNVALIGPGDTGPWRATGLDEDIEGWVVQRFATEIRIEDIMLLRTGRSTVCAVGLVASGYQYFPQFDDVNGLDLQHGRRVRWFELPEPYDFGEKVFGASPPRLSRVLSEDAVNYAYQIIQSPLTDWQTRALPQLPPEEPDLELVPADLETLIAEIQDLLYIYWSRDEFGERPTETESVAHHVVPFLRALGWPIQYIAVEWRNIDVCVFSELPRIRKHCHYLIEVKRLGAGVEGALEQARNYSLEMGNRCDIVVTDGVRYRMYEAHKNFAPVAYANLGRPKHSSLELFDRMRRP